MFEWTDEYSIKVDSMDKQHKKIIDYLNELEALDNSDSNKNEVLTIIEKLIEYTDFHFQEEESLMESLNYPGLAEHKIIHENIILKISQLYDQLQNGQNVAKEMQSFLLDWLLKHIKTVDSRYAAHAEKVGSIR